ncbi:hypothetical protein ATANTOWER_021533 [Ataeniobius toweri]|uniref:Uncharacterized protein n=1 Tax=Ataeniobius toweri TaxID=208326 RepID=A0ABU7BXC8_9TELE|nr:hypothetical protein [Ataeniobius toweri]
MCLRFPTSDGRSTSSTRDRLSIRTSCSATTSCPQQHHKDIRPPFLIMTSGLDKHGVDLDARLPYSHIDIAGSSGPFPGVLTGSPILAMATKYILQDVYRSLKILKNTLCICLNLNETHLT